MSSSLRKGLGLAQGLIVASSKALPTRGGAGAPIKLAPRPDKPVRETGHPAWGKSIKCCTLRQAQNRHQGQMGKHHLSSGAMDSIRSCMGLDQSYSRMLPAPFVQLPMWYETWWDNGIFPGQPAVDHMYGAMPGNLTEVRALNSITAACACSHDVSGVHKQVCWAVTDHD